MKLRQTLFAALIVGAMFPAVPASAAPLMVVSLTTTTPVVTTKLLETGLKISMTVKPLAPNDLIKMATDAVPPLPGVPVEVSINGVKKSGNTSPTTGIYEAKFTLGDFGENVPSGPVNVRGTAFPSLAAVAYQDTSITSIGHATLRFDTTLPASGLVEQIDSGASHTCVVTTDTGVRCWGSGLLGQIGNGASLESNRASAVRTGSGPLTGVMSIDAGTNHTCALKTNGEVWCWGSDARDQLGAQLSGSSSNVAVQADLDQAAVSVAAGSEHSCAVLVDSTIRCWGRPNASFLGYSTLTDPVLATFDPQTNTKTTLYGAVEVVAGQLHSCARMFDGSAMCWGDPSFNRLGGATGSDVAIPRPVPTVVRATKIEAGRAHSCAITETNAICWGFNINGQLGRGDTTTDPKPVSLAGVPTAMALGASHSCFSASGSTMCTGRNASGAFGNNTTTNSLSPVAVTQATGTFEMSAGDDHTCFVGPAASAVTRCAGVGANGRLGNLASVNSLVPVNVQGLDFARAIGGGRAHTCALLATPGKARCWGANASGQLGDTTTTPKLIPTSVNVRDNAYAIATGDDHNCLLAGTPGDATGDTLQCWGENGSGQIGSGTTTDVLVPTDIAGITPTAIALGGNHSCAIVPVGARNGVKCWGSDATGQLGDDAALVNKTSPVFVSGLDGSQAESVVSIDAGADHTCAALEGGSLRCWGSNLSFQLGQTDGDLAATPLIAEFIEGAVEVAAGAGWTCIREAAGTIQCFGRNDHGQIGYPGPDSPYPIPVAGGITGAGLIRAGGGHSCVVVSGSLDLQCFGQNDRWQLGNDTPENAALPDDDEGKVDPVDNPFKVSPMPEDFSSEVTGGALHTCAILRDTTVRCWGANDAGQLGDGTTIDRGVPAVITL